MNEAFNIPPLSKESICIKLRCIDRALSNLGFTDKALKNLDSSHVLFLEPDLCNSKLIRVLLETRDCLLTQLDALGEFELREDFLPESLEYTYQVESMRNGIGRRM